MEWDEEQTFPLEVVKKLRRAGLHGRRSSRKNWAAPAWATSSTRSSSRNCRAWTLGGHHRGRAHSLCYKPHLQAGNDEQKRRYHPETGDRRMDRVLVAHRARSGLRRRRHAHHTRCCEDGCWVLNGGKTFTTNAHYADVCVAMAVTDRAAAQHGISAFIIEKGTPGFRVRQEGKQARHARQRHRGGDVRELPLVPDRSCSAS